MSRKLSPEPDPADRLEDEGDQDHDEKNAELGRQLAALARLDEQMRLKDRAQPSEVAARVVLDVLEACRGDQRRT